MDALRKAAVGLSTLFMMCFCLFFRTNGFQFTNFLYLYKNTALYHGHADCELPVTEHPFSREQSARTYWLTMASSLTRNRDRIFRTHRKRVKWKRNKK